MLGGYDRAPLRVRAVYATAADGVKVPISLVYRKGPGAGRPRADASSTATARTASRLPVTFSSNRLSLLDRGVVFALAHVRGGGEMGKPGTTTAG